MANLIGTKANQVPVNGYLGTSAFVNIEELYQGYSSSVQTLTNKVLKSAVVNGGYTEEVYVLTGTTPSLTATNGSIQTWTLTAASSPTDGLSSGQSIILGIDDGTAYTITWPSVVWTKAGGSGAAPSLNATVRTWVVLWKVGTTLYGSYLGDA